jgi:hypothetical protein
VQSEKSFKSANSSQRASFRRKIYLKSFVAEIEPELLNLVEISMNELKSIYQLFQQNKFHMSNDVATQSTMSLASEQFSEEELRKFTEEYNLKMNKLFPSPSQRSSMVEVITSATADEIGRESPKEEEKKESHLPSSSIQDLYQEALNSFHGRQTSLLCKLFSTSVVSYPNRSSLMETFNPSSNEDIEDMLAVYFLILGIGKVSEQIKMLSKKSKLLVKKRILHIPFLCKSSVNDEVCNLDDLLYVETTKVDQHNDLNTKVLNFQYETLKRRRDSVKFPPLRPLTSNSFCISITAIKVYISYYFRRFTRSKSIQYSFKVAFLCFLVGLLSLAPFSRTIFKDWKGKWAINTIIVVNSPTIGSSVVSGGYRMIGTIFGGLYAYLCAQAFSSGEYIANIILTVIFGVITTLIRQRTKFPRLGFIMLISYCVVLYDGFEDQKSESLSYSDSVFVMALKRISSICVGVLMNAVFSLLISPYFARTALRVELAGVMSKIGELYSKINIMMIRNDEIKKEEQPRAGSKLFKRQLYNLSNYSLSAQLVSSTSVGAVGSNAELKEMIKLELEIQNTLYHCEKLLEDSTREPLLLKNKQEMKSETYKKLLESSQFILNRLLSIRLILSTHLFSEDFHKVLMTLLTDQKRVLSNVLLTMYIMNHTLLTKSALPPSLPLLSESNQEFLRNFQGMGGTEYLCNNYANTHFIFVFTSYSEIIRELEGMLYNLRLVFSSQESVVDLLDVQEYHLSPDHQMTV